MEIPVTIDNEVNDVFVKKGELPLSAQSAYSAIPTSREEARQFTYFNNEKKITSNSTYDRLFKWGDGFNNKLHRCDREHAKSRGLTVHDEEFNKPRPALTSTDYGHKLHLHVDHPDRKHVRIIKTKEFLSNNGITFSVEQGYGKVTPA
uniref:Protein C5orf49-like n=1 Tax=Ciona intestinalis TaxID=7719 RepID=H2XJK4_CIOIN|nr:uncharacterized protein C5orf49 [Ciona intestinalis]|eukprot:XP_002128478.1 uncharacterized protein C5orf49 [Ciona intestinalis]